MNEPEPYQNPVIPGFFPDPSVVRVGGDYYLVNSTFQYFPAIVISHSRDLVNWRQIGHVFTDSGALDLTGFYDGCGIWAPDISWHDGEFFIFYCLVQLKMDRSVNVRGNYVVKSKSIHGPWSPPVRLTDHGNDPSHFVDDDGAHYLLYAAGIPRGSATRIVRLNDDCTRVIGEARWIDYGIEVKAPEGPHLIKKDGWYYHTMAAGSGVYDGHHQLIARSRNIFGPYEPGPHNPFIAQHNGKSAFYHHGHAKLVSTVLGNWWSLYLIRRRIGGFSPLGRETALDKVDWLDDGWPVINRAMGPSEPRGRPRPQESVRDDFEDAQLSTDWQFVRNPDQSHFDLSERRGWLRVLSRSHDVDSPAPLSVIVRRETSHHFSAITRMEFHPETSEEAGIIAYYASDGFIKFGLRAGGIIRLEQCRAGNRHIIAETTAVTDGVIELRMEVDGLHRAFSLRPPGGDWIEAGTIPNASHLSDEGTSGWGFTGTMTGVFAVHHGSCRFLPAWFDFFTLEPGSYPHPGEKHPESGSLIGQSAR